MGNSNRNYPPESLTRASAHSGAAIRVQLLQRMHSYLAALKCCNPLGRSARRRQGGNRRDARCHRCAPNRLLIKPGLLARRGVDDELNALALDEVDNVWAPFFHLIDALH